eukprot:scaffold258560_cov43-Tisochrysis_lutea.AAC.1
MDMEMLCRTTYKLEGDGVEILLVHDAIELLRVRGRTLASQACHLPNVAAILRQEEPLRIGLATREYYDAPHHSWFHGSVTAVGNGAAWTITYADGSTLVINDESEMRNAIDVCALPAWKKAIGHVAGAFTYLEDRLTDNCARPYGCKDQHRITGLL